MSFSPEDKILKSGEALMSRFKFHTYCGHAELQGRRPTMEDRILVSLSFCLLPEVVTFLCHSSRLIHPPPKAIPNLEIPGDACQLANPVSFYAVLDGHGGDWAVQRAADLLPEKLVENLAAGQEPTQALYNAFIDTDKIVVSEALKPKPKAEKKTDATGFRFSALLDDADISVTEVSGTTCVCIIIDAKGRLYSANIGDSRAILLNQNTGDGRAAATAAAAQVALNGTEAVSVGEREREREKEPESRRADHKPTNTRASLTVELTLTYPHRNKQP